MSLTLKSILSLVIFSFASLAQADQCQWTDRFTAQVARSIIAKQGMVVTYCAKCGNQTKRAYMLAKDNAGTKDGMAIHFRDQGVMDGQRYWEFSINEGYANEAQLDLAYTYIVVGNLYNGDKRQLVNVGALAFGCNPAGVPEVLDWNPSEVLCQDTEGGNTCG